MLHAIATGLLIAAAATASNDWIALESELDPGYRPRNMVAPLVEVTVPKVLPLKVDPHEVHIRRGLPSLPNGGAADAVLTSDSGTWALSGLEVYLLNPQGSWTAATVPQNVSPTTEQTRVSPRVRLRMLTPPNGGAAVLPGPPFDDATVVNDVVEVGTTQWIASSEGLYLNAAGTQPVRHKDYGVDGPLASRVTALATDTTGNLWVGTPIGLSVRDASGKWRPIQGKDGLPFEDITALTVDANDQLWIGTSRGVIHYRPNDPVRKWFYRAGPRYLPQDYVNDIAVSADAKTVYVATPAGVSTICIEQTTLRQKADNLEARVALRHRRMGLVGICEFEDPTDLTKFRIPDAPNDGLWTAYHVTALSLAFATTGDDAHKESARAGMHALYMLQNASGIPGITARSVLPAADYEQKLDRAKKSNRPRKDEEWYPSSDASVYWRADTSSDEYCGHYMAFYAYWEHIARHDPDEKELIIRQVRQMTDYLILHGFVFIDKDGEPTTWGKWSPEVLNEDPRRFGENGLGALEICSFLNTAFHITGDKKYREHYLTLLQKHDYLSNILTEKKIFPDEENHSDDQLAFCSWYPILQTEHDPKIRYKLHQAVQRHAIIDEQER